MSLIIVTVCDWSAGCRWTLTTLSGTITSPGYPNNYPTSLQCRWIIKVPNRYRINLYFDEFVLQSSALSCNLGCTCDKLDVSYKPDGYLSSIKKTYCMKYVNAPPYQLNTYSNLVILDFHSDGSVTAPGFKIHYKSFLNGPGIWPLYTLLQHMKCNISQASYLIENIWNSWHPLLHFKMANSVLLMWCSCLFIRFNGCCFLTFFGPVHVYTFRTLLLKMLIVLRTTKGKNIPRWVADNQIQ